MDFTENLGLDRYPYPSRRMPLFARRGVVATEEPLAAQAGLRMLLRGGNAVDAAIATAIALTVTEPVANGIGSDTFVLVWDGERLHALNGSGRACAAHTPRFFADRGLTAVPMRGWSSVTVPGAPAAWRDLHARFGRLPFEVLFEPAIEYAEQGFPVAPLTAARWAASARGYASFADAADTKGWYDTFTRGGRVPGAGETWSCPDMGRTLRRLAESGVESFYRGDVAKLIAEFAARTDGHLTLADLAAHTSTWVDPIRVRYRGYDVWEVPPNGNGIVALSALAILDGIDLAKHPRESVESYHLQIEAIKLAFADASRYVADPAFVDLPVQGLLDPSYASLRRAQIGERAAVPEPGAPPKGGTVYLCAADADGMMVSLIQSNYSGPLLGFGSGVVVPETGISLQSRGCAFSLDPTSPNVIAPGKRPAHTIIPGFLTRDGAAVGPFGVMGGPMQPQGHVQMVVNQIDYGMNPQTSVDAPRWQWLQDLYVDLESSVPDDVKMALAARGHDLTVSGPWDVANAVPRPTPKGKYVAYGDFGKAQIICRRRDGTYVAGSESRADGCAVGY
ncbi:MAG: gamma-glutamyltransferase family protein [Labilithrix sp.]|nr:gamma-glutamyltransferase family protein [Labilithrix sp.]